MVIGEKGVPRLAGATLPPLRVVRSNPGCRSGSRTLAGGDVRSGRFFGRPWG